MKKVILIAMLALAGAAVFTASAQLKYAVTGAYQKMPGQGMAIWEDNAYLFNQTGYCRVFDLKAGEVTAEFRLDSSYEKNHANSVSFGVEVPQGSLVPALYITEFNGKYACFVEKVIKAANGGLESKLIQTIEFKDKGKNPKIVDWVVDRDGGCLFATFVDEKAMKESGEQVVVITKLPLPALSDGAQIVYTEKDILDRFTVSFVSGLQGATVRGKYLYIVTGMQESQSDQPGHERAVQVIDLKKKELTKTVDLTTITVNAPQDLDFHGNTPLLFCGQNGGLYKVKL
ncbi:MAG: hypothetical protein LUC24_02565 [Bacteroidales bacterium]|nr:hypothetical protein [Bacteroidales bacterium]